MSWTADPVEIVQRMQQSTGRPARVYEAVLEILRQNLIPVLDQLGFIPQDRRAHVYPKAYHLAGENIGEPNDAKGWPRIIVGGAIQEEEFAMGWQDTIQVSVTVAWPGPVIGRREFVESLDVACVCSGIFRYPQFHGAFEDPDNPGEILWYQMMPAGYSLVPPDWKHYSGWIAHLLARQSPGSNLW